MSTEEEDDDNIPYDDDGEEEDEEDSDSYESESDDEEELEALQLLSEQMQEAKRTNQVLKQALIASVEDKKKDKSSSELVASLMAGRKGSSNMQHGQAGTLSSALQDQTQAEKK